MPLPATPPQPEPPDRVPTPPAVPALGEDPEHSTDETVPPTDEDAEIPTDEVEVPPGELPGDAPNVTEPEVPVLPPEPPTGAA